MSSVVPQDFSKAKVESIFSLSPIQEGMLFHLLYEPSAGLYINQLHYRLEGFVRPDCLQKAWQRVIDWQPTLRTLFLWENRKKPAQVVRTEARLPWLELDWSAFSKNDQADKLETFLKEDRKQGFDLKRAPLMRVTFIRLAEQAFHVVWSHHHLILDGWAGSLLNEAVFKAYVSYCENRVPEFPAAVSYKNYVNWLLEQDAAAAEFYWREQLKSFNTPTRINSARPLLSTPGKSFESVELSLSASETEAFHSTARTARVTPSILCQAAWGLILHRYADEDDVVFGVTVAGRSQEAQALQELIGLTINTVPVRLKIEGSCLLGNWVQLLLQQQIAREKFSWSPLSDITRWSEVKGSASLFETVLVFENFPRQEQLIHHSNGLKVGAVQAIERTNYPVTVVIEPENQLHIQIVFDQAKFTRELASQIISDFKHNLISASNKLNLPLLKWDLPSDLVPPVLIVPAQRPSKWDKAHGVHEHFEANAQLYAARHAVHMAGERDGVLSHTYAALDRRANQVASLLRKNGIDRGCFVGLYFQRSVEMVVAMLAVLKAGAAYVPLDPSYPLARVEFMLRDSGVKVLLTHRAAGKIGTLPAVIDLDADAELISKQPDVPVHGLNIQAEDAAYVIYTSGSTGKPKGVIVTHGNITRLFRSTDHWFCFCPDDVWTLFHSYAFDFSVWEIWGALLYGGRLVVVPFLESRTPEDFYRIVKKERVTVLNQTPSAFRQLSQVDEQFNEKQLALRWVIFGGEALELQTLAGWFGRHGDMTPQLVNMYGITETTVHVTFRVIRARDLDSKSSLIGEPIPDLDIILTDKHQRLIPNGVAGEISVGGAGLARGYLDRPELTAERFIPNPWGPSGSRLYRSGDLARRLPNGDLEYLGRIDHQVKIRGHRIETGEIECVLSRHPQVRDQAVLVTKSKIGSEGSSQNQLVAYVVPRETEPSLSELRQFISKYLPDYMLPASFVFLGVLPLTENGKLNRAALPSPESLGQNSRESYVAPRNGEEEVMAGIWSEVLGLDRVGAFDNYFELGGDSIKSLWLMGRCKQVGLHFSLQELFSHPTVAELCRRIVKSNSPENSDQPSRAFATLLPPDLDMIPPDVEDAYPLSALQAGMIFHSSISPELSHYHNVSSFHLKAPFDKIHFRLALDEVAQKHPVLRTSFEMTRFKQPLQLVHKHARIPFDVVDLSGSTFEKQEVEIKEFVDAEKKNPFNLSIAPLLRFCAHIRD
ncbi:MAG: amino acid adenylation domain protein, partial [Verrucomicrobiales bacterium]|nr:amino acid adenylation domain protein [Verrucomicrobiales bacterium]